MTVVLELVAALGDDVVLTGDKIDTRFRSDMSLTGHVMPLAVIRPVTVEHVSLALSTCNRHRQPIVPQGGLTGLAGGANPDAGNITLSLERMSGIEELDPVAGTMTVKAGTVLEKAQQAAADAGFMLAVDLGSRGSCQIGGNLSTNAGGIRVLRHGMTRDNVLGLEAVLADGTIISSLNRMQKNNTGYDLKQLFLGSEGTLGIITRAVLKLKPLPQSRVTALCALDSYAAVLELLDRARRDLSGLSAFEVMWESYSNFNETAENVTLFPKTPAFSVIIEQDGRDESENRETLESFLGECLEASIITDALMAQSEREARRFWTVREGVAMDRLLQLINFDVSLPIASIGDFADACRNALEAAYPGCHNSYYGHIADSNLHIAVSVGSTAHVVVEKVDRIVYDIVRSFAGSVSAEHGIGTLKRDYLSYSRSPAEIDLMCRLKNMMDPNGILNPGKVLLSPIGDNWSKS